MQVALIPPLSMLYTTQETNMQLLLPALFASEEYAAHAYIAAAEGNFCILDNGIAEGDVTHPEVLIALAKEFKCNEVVVPDVMGDMLATITAIDDFAPYALAHPTAHYMAVLQGQTVEECLMVARHVAATAPWVSTLGIPRHLVRTTGIRDVRIMIVMQLDETKLCEDKAIHFLGTAPTWPEEIKFANMCYYGRIRSVDTSLPYNYTWAKELLHNSNMHGNVQVARPQGYFEMSEFAFDVPMMHSNIKVLLDWANYGTHSE